MNKLERVDDLHRIIEEEERREELVKRIEALEAYVDYILEALRDLD